MSETPKHLSVSFRVDNGCVEHNNRNFFSDNVDKNRTPDNITYVRRDLRELYHELFDEALAEFSANPLGQENSRLLRTHQARQKRETLSRNNRDVWQF